MSVQRQLRRKMKSFVDNKFGREQNLSNFILMWKFYASFSIFSYRSSDFILYIYQCPSKWQIVKRPDPFMAAPYSMHDDVNIDATLGEADIFRRFMCKHNYVNVIAHLTVVREPASKKVLRELLKLHLAKALTCRARNRERKSKKESQIETHHDENA